MDPKTQHMQQPSAAPVEAASEVPAEPVAWWNGMRDDPTDEAHGWHVSPSEDKWHDIPLFDGANKASEYTAAAIAAARAEGAEQMRDVLQRCVTGIDHLSELARLWEPDHSSGADRRGWLLANDARDDAAALLRALPVNAPNAPK